MVLGAKDEEIRAEYEYIKTQAYLFREVLSTFATLAEAYTSELRMRATSDLQFNYLADMAKLTEDACTFVQRMAFEATMIQTAIGERLDEIVALYEQASADHIAALKNTP